MPDTIADVDRILRERWSEVMSADTPKDGDPSAIILFNPNRGVYYYIIVESSDQETQGWVCFRLLREKAAAFRTVEDFEFICHQPTAGQCAVTAITIMEEQP